MSRRAAAYEPPRPVLVPGRPAAPWNGNGVKPARPRLEAAAASAAPRTLLVVDDDPDIRSALAELLESEGYAVTSAANGAIALAHLRAGLRPCAILLDLMMPQMNGWEFRAAQLRDPELSQIPVILLTASGYNDTTIRAEFGHIEYFPKPPSPDRLLATIRSLVAPH